MGQVYAHAFTNNETFFYCNMIIWLISPENVIEWWHYCSSQQNNNRCPRYTLCPEKKQSHSFFLHNFDKCRRSFVILGKNHQYIKTLENLYQHCNTVT